MDPKLDHFSFTPIPDLSRLVFNIIVSEIHPPKKGRLVSYLHQLIDMHMNSVIAFDIDVGHAHDQTYVDGVIVFFDSSIDEAQIRRDVLKILHEGDA